MTLTAVPKPMFSRFMSPLMSGFAQRKSHFALSQGMFTQPWLMVIPKLSCQ